MPSAFAASLGLPLGFRLGLRLELGFGCRLRLRLQFGLGLADLLGAPLLVGDPVRHLLAGLVATVQLVLFSIRRLGRAEPFSDLGLQFRGEERLIMGSQMFDSTREMIKASLPKNISPPLCHKWRSNRLIMICSESGSASSEPGGTVKRERRL